MDSAIKNKLQSLLRFGLVSQNNVRRAMTLFQDPERYAKSPAYRTLMQEILVDVVDKIVNNRVLYTALRTSITKEKNAKETLPVTEGTQTDRTNALLRSGLVDKSEIAVARKAFKSPEAALRMSTVKTYREMMVGLMDSMLRKITGNPALFNAFKRTMGKETVEESFDYANSETITLCELDESAAETLAENKPTNTKLWSEAKTNARRAFTEYPSPCASGWAVKWYNEQGGDWASISEGKSFFQFAKAADDSVITESHTEESAAQARETFVNHPAYKPPTRTGLPETPEQREVSRAARIAALRASQRQKPPKRKPVQEENAHTNKIDLQGEEMTTYLAVIHSAQIYRSRILSIVKNYKKKLKSGKYNPELAVKGFVYAVEDGLAERTKQTGVKMRLSGEQKLKVARELLDYYSDEIGEDMVKEGYEAMTVVEKNLYGDFIDAYGKKIPNRVKPESKLSKITKCIKKTIGEETEQLDELKKSTLLRYIPKAEGDKRFSRFASQSPNDISSDEKENGRKGLPKDPKVLNLLVKNLLPKNPNNSTNEAQQNLAESWAQSIKRISEAIGRSIHA